MFDIKIFNEYESFFYKNHESSYELIEGSGPVMISAPHSVEQTRNGKKKYAEPQTGALAKLLHDSLNCPVIYKTSNCGDDANFDDESTYKDAIVDYVKKHGVRFVLDLHQLASFRDVTIDIGTGKFKNIDSIKYVNIVLRAFSCRDIGIIQIDTPFDASSPFTISSYVAKKCGICCLQLEINSNAVNSKRENSEVGKVFDALSETIVMISKSLTQKEI
ncbi:MAG TPA: hypothetical protein PLT66_04735 [Bacillota bacterium]|nr:hypothetical protein [Bacillota bacterium]